MSRSTSGRRMRRRGRNSSSRRSRSSSRNRPLHITIMLRFKIASKMERPRSNDSRQNRLLKRLATSANTLVCLHLGVPIPPDVQHPFPIPPVETVRLLTLLAHGVPVEVVLHELEFGARPGPP